MTSRLAVEMPQDFNAAFTQLDALLLEWQQVWRQQPFKQPELTWYREFPQWRKCLQSLDDASVEQLSQDPTELARFACQVLGIRLPDGLLDVPLVVPEPLDGDACDLPEGVSPRKWAQIQALLAALKHSSQASARSVVEWCSGKAHLSRGLLQTGLADSAQALEHNAALIEDGLSLARRCGLNIAFHRQDVLAQSVSRFCWPGSRHIALHACGSLHVNMLERCCEGGVDRLDLVPCCYHRDARPAFRPLSAQARRSQLYLDRDALKLAVQETVTAPASARRQRIRLQQWRLGFDCLVRHLSGRDEYTALPSMNSGEAGPDFSAFCRHAGRLKRIELPADIDFGYFERLGRQRFSQVSREDLVRQVFRRPLELWLVYDRCLYLQEHGYAVSLREFCSRRLTPRNLWIQARRLDCSDA